MNRLLNCFGFRRHSPNVAVPVIHYNSDSESIAERAEHVVRFSGEQVEIKTNGTQCPRKSSEHVGAFAKCESQKDNAQCPTKGKELAGAHASSESQKQIRDKTEGLSQVESECAKVLIDHCQLAGAGLEKRKTLPPLARKNEQLTVVEKTTTGYFAYSNAPSLPKAADIYKTSAPPRVPDIYKTSALPQVRDIYRPKTGLVQRDTEPSPLPEDTDICKANTLPKVRDIYKPRTQVKNVTDIHKPSGAVASDGFANLSSKVPKNVEVGSVSVGVTPKLLPAQDISSKGSESTRYVGLCKNHNKTSRATLNLESIVGNDGEVDEMSRVHLRNVLQSHIDAAISLLSQSKPGNDVRAATEGGFDTGAKLQPNRVGTGQSDVRIGWKEQAMRQSELTFIAGLSEDCGSTKHLSPDQLEGSSKGVDFEGEMETAKRCQKSKKNKKKNKNENKNKKLDATVEPLDNKAIHPDGLISARACRTPKQLNFYLSRGHKVAPLPLCPSKTPSMNSSLACSSPIQTQRFMGFEYEDEEVRDGPNLPNAVRALPSIAPRCRSPKILDPSAAKKASTCGPEYDMVLAPDVQQELLRCMGDGEGQHLEARTPPYPQHWSIPRDRPVGRAGQGYSLGLFDTRSISDIDHSSSEDEAVTFVPRQPKVTVMGGRRRSKHHRTPHPTVEEFTRQVPHKAAQQSMFGAHFTKDNTTEGDWRKRQNGRNAFDLRRPNADRRDCFLDDVYDGV